MNPDNSGQLGQDLVLTQSLAGALRIKHIWAILNPEELRPWMTGYR
jgi:hypothetical protein